MVKLKEIGLDDEKSVLDILTDNISITILTLYNKISHETDEMMIEADEIYVPEVLEEIKKELNELILEVKQSERFSEDSQTYGILSFLFKYFNKI